MKKQTLLIAIAALGLLSSLVSCKKESWIEKKDPQVTYTVSCARCLVTYNDQYDEKKQAVVSGTWNYSFVAPKLDSAKLQTETPATVGPIHVDASISINGKIVSQKTGEQVGYPVMQKVALLPYKKD